MCTVKYEGGSGAQIWKAEFASDVVWFDGVIAGMNIAADSANNVIVTGIGIPPYRL
jgi:hypothetical protein